MADLNRDDLGRLRQLTGEFGADPECCRDALEHQTVLCWFMSPAPAISQNVDTAVARLGGTMAEVNAHELVASRVGSVENAGRVLSQLGRAIVVGGLDHAGLVRFAEAATVPVVNAFSDEHDPCQALAELVTLERRFGSLLHTKVGYIAATCNLLDDMMDMAALAGITLVIAAPDGGRPPPHTAAYAHDLAARYGGRIELTDDPEVAVEGARAVLVDPLVEDRWSGAVRALTPEVLATAHPDVMTLSCRPDRVDRRSPLPIASPVNEAQLESHVCIYQSVLYGLTQSLLYGP